MPACGSEAADWQSVFSYRLTNVVPGSLEELTHSDGENRTSPTRQIGDTNQLTQVFWP